MRKWNAVIVVACFAAACGSGRRELGSSDAQRAGLGFSQAQLAAMLGEPVHSSPHMLDFRKCPGQPVLAQWNAMLAHDKAIAITRNACPPDLLTATAAEAESKLLLPSDAGPGRAFVTSDGWPAVAYTSALLAASLPADQFKDCNGKLVAPGTFFYLLSPDRRSWLIGAGMCP